MKKIDLLKILTQPFLTLVDSICSRVGKRNIYSWLQGVNNQIIKIVVCFFIITVPCVSLANHSDEINKRYRFVQTQRDPFIQEKTANELLDFNNKFLNDEFVTQILNDPNADPDRRASVSRNRADTFLQNLILSYSMGTSITEMLPLAERTFAEFDRHYREYPGNGYKLKLWEKNGYQYAFWLLGLAYLLGMDDYVVKVASWISPEEGHGHDPLFATLFEQLGVSSALPTGPSLLHPKGYTDLWKIVQHPHGNQNEQATLMQSYIRNWYRGVIGETVWQGWDDKGWIYFGFWSFEAGLVTVLYGLDDSDYQHMTFYPKDLVEYARNIKNCL